MPTLDSLLADLIDAYPRQQVARPTIEVYRRELADLPPDVLARAVRHLLRTSDFFPSIAEIRNVTARLLLTLPSDVEAIGQVEARIVWARDYQEADEDRPHVHEAVAEALTAVGGYAAWKKASAPAIIRGQFAKAYRQVVADRVERVQVDLTPALPASDAA